MKSRLKTFINKIFGRKTIPFLLETNNKLNAGNMSFHNGNFNIEGGEQVKIGNYCAFGKNITIITNNHDYNFPAIQYTFYRKFFGIDHPGISNDISSKSFSKGPVIIGNDVWIGHNVTILSGVTIGNGAILGNGSIVTKNVEDYSIVAGVPAKFIKKRFTDDVIQFLMEIEWWNWDEKKIRANKDFFSCNLNKVKIEELKRNIK